MRDSQTAGCKYCLDPTLLYETPLNRQQVLCAKKKKKTTFQTTLFFLKREEPSNS